MPKASEKVLLGKEFRSLFCSEDGLVVAAGDASALEGRVEGHYTSAFDGGERARIILEGDIHSRNAKLFYPTETEGFDLTGASEGAIAYILSNTPDSILEGEKYRVLKNLDVVSEESPEAQKALAQLYLNHQFDDRRFRKGFTIPRKKRR